MIPVTSSMLSSLLTTRIPSGGLVWSSPSSRMMRRMTAGVTDYKLQLVVYVEIKLEAHHVFVD